MRETADYLKIVRRAQLGDRESMDRLAQLAQGRIFVYIYRLTLSYDLSQDLTQETMLEMIRSLKKLKKADRFWPWLFRTALGKVQHYFRRQGPGRMARQTTVNTAKVLEHAPKDYQTGLTALVRKESKQLVLDAMGQINFVYRNVLTLRCFEQMPYSVVASILGCTELKAQLLFFRAKRSLRKQLSRRGFGKEHFLSALGLFGAITAVADKPASAAVAVSAASTQVGIVATVVGSATTGLGTAAVIGLAATVLAVAQIGVFENGKQTSSIPTAGLLDIQAIRSFEFPSSMVNAHDPDGDGWKGSSYTQRMVRAVPVVPSRLLVGRHTPDMIFVVLPKDHWVELEFPSTIVDGPGADICTDGRVNDGQPRIFITDAAGQEYELAEHKGRQFFRNGFALTGYDIAGVPLSFEPRAVRILGTGTTDTQFGFELYTVKARVAK